MTRNKLLALLLLAWLVTAVTPVAAQTSDGRQELKLRLRTAAGAPVSNVEVELIRHYDQAPMGSRITNSLGEAVWYVAPFLEYEFILPEHIELDQNTVAQLGDMGFQGIGIRMGGDAPAVMGIVVADPSGQGPGSFAFIDASPDGLPSPVIIPDEADPDPGIDVAATATAPDIAETEQAAEGGATAEEDRYNWVSVLIWTVVVLAIVGLAIWLYPALRVLWE